MDISAFVASTDIPKTIKKNTEKWRNIIDYALKNSDKFVLVMTLGFNNRSEVKREFKLARKLDKETIYCKYKDMPKDELKIQINKDVIDLSEYEYIEFEDKPDLLNQVGLSLKYGIKSIVKRKGDVFLNHAYEIIKNEGSRLKQTSEPQIEIVMGSNNIQNVWLEPTDENKSIFRGHFFKPYRVTARRYFFEFSTIRENEYLKIYTNGFYHTIMPIYHEKDICSLESIIHDILCHLIYFIKLLNSKKVSINQFVYITFRNISNKLFTLEDRWRRQYSFSKDKFDVRFSFSFAPNLKWVDYKKIFIHMFREIFLELGIDDINNTFIEKIIKDLMSAIVHGIPGIDIKDFEFI